MFTQNLGGNKEKEYYSIFRSGLLSYPMDSFIHPMETDRAWWDESVLHLDGCKLRRFFQKFIL